MFMKSISFTIISKDGLFREDGFKHHIINFFNLHKQGIFLSSLSIDLCGLSNPTNPTIY